MRKVRNVSRPDAQSAGLDAKFAAVVRYRREQAGLSQADIAAMMAEAGYAWHPQTAHRVEHGQRKVTIGEALTLADRLSFSVAGLNGMCETCQDSPPDGFTCSNCGKSAARQPCPACGDSPPAGFACNTCEKQARVTPA